MSPCDDFLDYAVGAVSRNPDTLKPWATVAAWLVYAGKLKRSQAWDTLWLAAVAGGLEHLVAQECIGEAFAYVKRHWVTV